MIIGTGAGGYVSCDMYTVCGSHEWHCESLRGTNRHRRVETLRCMMCGERRRRVWLNLPAQRRPDVERVLEERAKVVVS